MKEIILVKNGELALKGLNRSSFEDKLVKNIKHKISDLGDFEFTKSQSTIMVEPLDDDIDLDVGRLRIRRKGSAGGHNGLKSIISHLGSMDFPRVKIGVGEKPKGYDLADYVLGHFTKEEQAIFAERFDEVYDAVQLTVMGDITAAMNRHNKKK